MSENFLLRHGLALTIEIPQNRFVIKDENRSSKAKFSKKKKMAANSVCPKKVKIISNFSAIARVL